MTSLSPHREIIQESRRIRLVLRAALVALVIAPMWSLSTPPQGPMYDINVDGRVVGSAVEGHAVTIVVMGERDSAFTFPRLNRELDTATNRDTTDAEGKFSIRMKTEGPFVTLAAAIVVEDSIVATGDTLLLDKQESYEVLGEEKIPVSMGCDDKVSFVLKTVYTLPYQEIASP